MKRTQITTSLLVAMALAACGGGENNGGQQAPAEQGPSGAAATAPTGEIAMPSWMQADDAAKTVTIDLVAGKTPTLNYWNYNGATQGQGVIQVPTGYSVTIDFSNKDPNMAHSFGVEELQTPWPAALTPNPVFAGAVSDNPGSMTDGTMPGDNEVHTFTADKAGQYGLVCYIPGHAATGMWVHFNVVDGGPAGAAGFP